MKSSFKWTPRYHYHLRRQARHLSNDPRHSPTTFITTAVVIIRKRPAACSPVVSANHLNSTGLSCMDFLVERTYLRRPIIVGATARPAQAHYLQVPPTVVFPMWTAPAVAGSLPAVTNSRPDSEFHSATMAALTAVEAVATTAAVVIPPTPAAVPCYRRVVEEEVVAVAAVDFHHSMPRLHLRPFPRPCPHRWLSQRRQQQQRPLPSNICNNKHKPTYRRERSCGPTSTITALHRSGISGTSGVYPLPTTITTCTR